MADKIKLRRDTQANWEAVNPILDEGEFGYVTDTFKGKIGDGVTAFNNLQSIHGIPDGAINVKDFGAKGDGITDDTQAIQDALTYAYQNTFDTSGWRDGIPTVYFPNGKYVIKQPNVLFQGLVGMRFNIMGAGKFSTILEYDVPDTVTGEYMINDAQIFGFTTFSNMTFTSKNSNGNFFHMQGGGGGWTQNLTFVNVFFSSFENIFTVDGDSMCSEVTFLLCKIGYFNGYAFSFNNIQAVNWRFYATDIESFSGTVFKLYTSCPINFYQGSIIPTASTAKVFEVPAEANPDYFGEGGSPIYFNGVRFEIRNGALLFDKQSSGYLDIIFESCGMGGYNIQTDPYVSPINWKYGGNIVFNNCRNFPKYSMIWAGQGNTIYDYLTIVIDSFEFPIDSFISDSTFTLTINPNNVSNYPLFYTKRCSNSYLNNTTFYAKGKSLSKTIQNWHSVATTAESFTFAWGTFPISIDLNIHNVFISEIKLDPMISSISGDITVEITNADETTTLASFTYTPSTDTTQKVAYPSYFVDSTDSLKLKITGTDPDWNYVKGALWMLY